jgi:glycosyltransferase involved in cell wall biosynthesis
MMKDSASPGISVAPRVSVIVPARNEEGALAACPESLVGQTGLAFEILVVDDGSTDATRAIGLSFPGVTVVDARPLAAGWSGKFNAMFSGAQQARGEWLLFTDADTVHKPESLARSVREAEDHKVGLLSYSPEQDVRGFWQRAVMAVIFAELACTYPPTQVCDMRSPVAAANGQYMLILRKKFDELAANSAVRGSLLEDVALARALKKSGGKIRFRFGGDAVRTRMYRSFAQLREGWTKNLALLFPSTVRLAVMRSVEFLLILSATAAAIFGASRGAIGPTIIAAAIAAGVYGSFLLRVRNAHFGWRANLAAIVGLPVFSWLLLRSRKAYQRGHVIWKGRIYGRPQPLQRLTAGH